MELKGEMSVRVGLLGCQLEKGQAGFGVSTLVGRRRRVEGTGCNKARMKCGFCLPLQHSLPQQISSRVVDAAGDSHGGWEPVGGQAAACSPD